jgi:glycosyltransferase involved in cell wall biosynthesis
VQPSEIEGTALALVEAMGYGNCVLVSNIAENLETAVRPDSASISGAPRTRCAAAYAICWVRRTPSSAIARVARQKSLEYARANYSWERVADDHERLYYQAARRSP